MKYAEEIKKNEKLILKILSLEEIHADTFKKNWNEYARYYNFPKIMKMTKKRREKLKKRLQTYQKKEIFYQLQKSQHLANHSWFSFDWLIKSDENIEKFLNGNYDWLKPKKEKEKEAVNQNQKYSQKDMFER